MLEEAAKTLGKVSVTEWRREAAPHAARFFGTIGEALFASGDAFRSAIFSMRAALLDFQSVWFRQVFNAFLKLDQFKDCRALLKKLPHFFQVTSASFLVEKIERRIQACETLFGKGRCSEATNQAAELSKTHLSARVTTILGANALAEQRTDEGFRLLQQAFSQNPLDPDTWANLAEILSGRPGVDREAVEKTRAEFKQIVCEFCFLRDLLFICLNADFGDFVKHISGIAPSSFTSPLSEEDAMHIPVLLFILRERFPALAFERKREHVPEVSLLRGVIRWIAIMKIELPPSINISECRKHRNAESEKQNDIGHYFSLTSHCLLKLLGGETPATVKEDFLCNSVRMETGNIGLCLPKSILLTDAIRPSFEAIFQDLPDVLTHYVKEISYSRLKPLRDLERRIILRWLMVFWNIYSPEKEFLMVFEQLKSLFEQAIRDNDREFVLCLHFPLSHIYINLTQTQKEWKVFNELIERPLAAFFQKQAKKCGIKPITRPFSLEKAPLKIGFVYDRIVLNSPFKVLFSLLKTLSQIATSEYELFVYDLEYIEKTSSGPDEIRMLEKLGVHYLGNHSILSDKTMSFYYDIFGKCKMLRDRIIQDEIDVLIVTSCHEQSNFLFSTRTAPLQIYWTHGMHVYDVPGIDFRMTHSQGHDEIYSFEGFDYFGIPCGMDDIFYIPLVAPEAVQKIRNRFPPGTVILGSIGRMIKVDSPPYLEAVREILMKNPNTVYLACGGGGTENITSFLKKWNIENRFFFEGHVDSAVYGHAIDIYLNTFPLSAGESLNEFLAKGKVSMSYYSSKPEYQEFIPTSSEEIEMCKRLDISIDEYQMIFAYTRDDYVKQTCTFIQNISLREKVGRFYAEHFRNIMLACQKETCNSFRRMLTKSRNAL
ncbi:MAG: hypothetical protein WA705_08205 [Candidatus Ozemobacteraceae bacterium]